MKKAIIIWIGLLFLTLDTRIATNFFYPEFIPFETGAPISVSMIIDHLIGTSHHLDIFTDVVGYVLIMFVASRIVNENSKAFKAFVFSFFALLLYAANCAMPFFLNGEDRYATGFFLYLIYIFVKCLAMIRAGFVCCEMAENLENHAWNNVVAIFLILASAAGFIRCLCFFFELPVTRFVYYGLEVFFTVVYSVMYWKRRNYWDSGCAIPE